MSRLRRTAARRAPPSGARRGRVRPARGLHDGSGLPAAGGAGSGAVAAAAPASSPVPAAPRRRSPSSRRSARWSCSTPPGGRHSAIRKLDALIRVALEENKDLRIAALRVEQYNAQLQVAQAAGRAAGRRPWAAQPRRGQPEPLHPAGRRRLPGGQRLRDRRRRHLGDRLLGPGAPCQRIGARRSDGDRGGSAGAGPEPGGQRRLDVRHPARPRSRARAASARRRQPPRVGAAPRQEARRRRRRRAAVPQGEGRVRGSPGRADGEGGRDHGARARALVAARSRPRPDRARQDARQP